MSSRKWSFLSSTLKTWIYEYISQYGLSDRQKISKMILLTGFVNTAFDCNTIFARLVFCGNMPKQLQMEGLVLRCHKNGTPYFPESDGN